MKHTYAEIFQEFHSGVFNHFAGEKLSKLSVEPKDAVRKQELEMLRSKLCKAKSAQELQALSNADIQECATAIDDLKEVLKKNAVERICDDNGNLLPGKTAPGLPHKDPEKKPEAPKILPKTVATDWAPNIRRFSSTTGTFSWGTRYLDHVIQEINDGAPTLALAHTGAAKWMGQNPEYIDSSSADNLNRNMMSDLSLKEQKFFVPIKPATYPEIPYNSHPAVDTGWRTDRKGGEVLIFVGAQKASDAPMSFFDEANKLKIALEKSSDAKVRIVQRPSAKAMEDHLQALGKRVKDHNAPQVIVAFIGHGGSSREMKDQDSKRGWSASSEGSWWARESKARGGYVSISEQQVQKWMNEYVAPNTANVNLVLSACHSGSWVQGESGTRNT